MNKKYSKVGFIGLGLMGAPMAKNILKNGFDVSVYNRTPSRTVEFKKLDVKVAKTPSELTRTVDVIITMVTNGKDVENVLFGKNGVVYGAQKGLIVIDMSTIGPEAAKKISSKLQSYNIDFIDAPVTGSTPKAISGELTIFIGGKRTVYEKIKPILMAMGKNHHYMGVTSLGQAMKMINNQIIATTIEALSEGMLLSDAMGLSRAKVAEVLRTVPAMSPMMNLKLQNYISGSYPLLFSMANMSKDLGLALGESRKGKFKFPILTRLEDIFRKAKKKYPSKDFSAIIETLK